MKEMLKVAECKSLRTDLMQLQLKEQEVIGTTDLK